MAYTTVQEALNKALIEKQKYQANLVGKTFAYVYVDRLRNTITYKEVEFKSENFLHLTGLDYKNAQYQKRVLGIEKPTNADEFYKRLGTDDSLIKDVSFITEATTQQTQLTFKHTQDKLDNLSQIVNIAKKAEFIGRYKDPNSFDLAINRNKETLALVKDGDVYVPMSSRYGAAERFIASNDINPVLAIFSKSNEQQDYKLEYLNSKVSYGKKYFEKAIIDKLSLSSFENPKVNFNIGKLEEIKRTFLLSEEKYISNDLSEIAQLRKDVFTYNEATNAYEGKCKVFRNQIDKDYKATIAEDILNKQLESETDEKIKVLIKEEINVLPKFGSSLNASPNILKCEFKPLPDNTDVLYGNVAAVSANLNPFKGLIDRIKDGIKKLFTPNTEKQDKPDNTPTEKEPQEDSKPVEEDNSSTASPIPKDMTELLEAREAFAEKKIDQDEYKQVITQYMHSLHGKEQWEAAVEQLAKQLDQAPVNRRGLIDFELKSVQHNFDKRFAPKTESPRQTLDEIKRSAHEKYVKLQDKKAVSPAQEYNDKDHQSPHIR